MKKLALFLALFLTSPLFAQDIPITIRGGDAHVVKVDQIITVKVDKTVVTSFPFTLVAPADEGFYDWILPAGVQGVDKTEQFDVISAPKGEQSVRVKIRSAQIVDGKIKYITRYGSIAFVVGDIVPPVPPVPPAPPIPPSPIPSAGYRVLIVYESSAAMPSKQQAIITSKVVRDYLNSRCIEVGSNKEWRIWDKDESTDGMPDVWKQGMAKIKASSGPYPKIMITNGTTGTIEALPPDVPSMMELLKKY